MGRRDEGQRMDGSEREGDWYWSWLSNSVHEVDVYSCIWDSKILLTTTNTLLFNPRNCILIPSLHPPNFSRSKNRKVLRGSRQRRKKILPGMKSICIVATGIPHSSLHWCTARKNLTEEQTKKNVLSHQYSLKHVQWMYVLVPILLSFRKEKETWCMDWIHFWTVNLVLCYSPLNSTRKIRLIKKGEKLASSAEPFRIKQSMESSRRDEVGVLKLVFESRIHSGPLPISLRHRYQD